MVPAYSDSGRRSVADLGVDGDSVFVVQDSGRGTTGRWGQGARGDAGRAAPARNQAATRSFSVPWFCKGYSR